MYLKNSLKLNLFENKKNSIDAIEIEINQNYKLADNFEKSSSYQDTNQ